MNAGESLSLSSAEPETAPAEDSYCSTEPGSASQQPTSVDPRVQICCMFMIYLFYYLGQLRPFLFECTNCAINFCCMRLHLLVNDTFLLTIV